MWHGVLGWGRCLWIVGFGYGAWGFGVVWGLEHPYILIRIFSMLSGPAPMLPEVV